MERCRTRLNTSPIPSTLLLGALSGRARRRRRRPLRPSRCWRSAPSPRAPIRQRFARSCRPRSARRSSSTRWQDRPVVLAAEPAGSRVHPQCHGRLDGPRDAGEAPPGTSPPHELRAVTARPAQSAACTARHVCTGRPAMTFER